MLVAMHGRKYASGEHVDGWNLLRFLGGGANAEVWQARRDDASLVALKVLKITKTDREPFKRFVDEIEFHRRERGRPGILPILDASIPDKPSRQDPAWFSMPVARPIREALGEHPDLEVVVQVVTDLAATLTQLAQDGISHRDLKPENILALGREVLLADFGLVSFPGKDPITTDAKALGPRNYIAPEMLTRPAEADARLADVYSLAKTMWVLASGAPAPPPGELRTDTDEHRVSAQVSHPRAPLLDQLIEACTRHNPERRPTMADLHDELRAWVSPPTPSSASDVQDLAARVRAATASNEREARQRAESWHRFSDILVTIANRLQPLARQLHEQGLGDGQLKDGEVLLRTYGINRFTKYGEVLYLGSRLIFVQPTGMALPNLFIGIGAELYDTAYLHLVATHVIRRWGTAANQLLWHDAHFVRADTPAVIEKTLDVLIAGLEENLRTALEAYVTDVENYRPA